MTGVFCCLSTESRPVWWFRLRQRWAGPVWQRRTESSPQRGSLGSAIAAVSGLHTLWASVERTWTLDKTSSNHPTVSSHHRHTLARQRGTFLLSWSPSFYAQTVTGCRVVRWPHSGDAETSVLPWHGWLWQLVALDKMSFLSLTGFIL